MKYIYFLKYIYCVICEIEGIQTKACDEIDIGFGPAPVCKRHKKEFKHLKFKDIADIQL